MRALQGFFVAILLTSFLGCGLLKPPIVGSGNIIAQPIDVTEFEEIDFSGGGSMVVEAGSSQSTCVIEVDDNLIEHIHANVENGELRIYSTARIAPSKGLIVRISTPKLRQLSSSGSSESTITGLSGPEFKVDVSGSGDVTCTGAVEHFSFDVSGSGSVDAKELQCKHASIAVSGSGKAIVNADEKLDVAISGSGDVIYYGSPKIEKSISGSGSIEAAK
jgi:hypothetical protein